MDLRIFIEPQQGADYDDQLAVAWTAEDAGYNAFFRSDHFLAMGGVSGEPGPTDSWLTLAGLARETPTIRLAPWSPRPPSGGPGRWPSRWPRSTGCRVDGSSWAGRRLVRARARRLRGPVPRVAERFDRLTEQLEIITGLWRTLPGERFDYSGVHYTVTDSPALPKPVQQPAPPVIVGGTGKQRTPMLAARFAAEINVAFNSIETTAAAFERTAAACAEIGRKPADLVRSAAQPIAVGRTDEEVARRALTIGKPVDDLTAGRGRDPRRGRRPARAVARRTGVTRFYLQPSTSPTSTRSISSLPRSRPTCPETSPYVIGFGVATAGPDELPAWRGGTGTRSRSSATVMSPGNSSAASAPKAAASGSGEKWVSTNRRTPASRYPAGLGGGEVGVLAGQMRVPGQERRLDDQQVDAVGQREHRVAEPVSITNATDCPGRGVEDVGQPHPVQHPVALQPADRGAGDPRAASSSGNIRRPSGSSHR